MCHIFSYLVLRQAEGGPRGRQRMAYANVQIACKFIVTLAYFTDIFEPELSVTPSSKFEEDKLPRNVVFRLEFRLRFNFLTLPMFTILFESSHCGQVYPRRRLCSKSASNIPNKNTLVSEFSTSKPHCLR